VRALVAAIVLGALLAPPARAGFEQPIRNARYPTAGLLAHREYDVELRITPESSAQGGVRVGVKDRLMVGAFYGVQRLFEADDPDFNDHLGFNARFLVEMLSNLDSDQIKISMSAPNKAGVIHPTDKDKNEDVLMLVMPVMLNQYV
jgi:hypothetical protein